MANDTIVGAPLSATGGILSAPAGTALPTSASTAPGAAFIALGLVGEEGVEETADRSTEQIRAWGGSVARVVQTEFGLSYSFEFLETNAAVLKEVFGADNVTTTTAVAPAYDELAIKINNKQLPIKSYVLELKDGDNKIRIVIPNGQFTAMGNRRFTHTDIVRYQITMTCYADDAGNEAYQYITGPAVDA